MVAAFIRRGNPPSGRDNNVVFPSQAYAKSAQSCGNEPPGPGLMSFQKVKLPSAPNLYSSVPPFGLLAWNHSALLNVDSGVESGSSAGALTGCGFKPLPMSVHCVTLPSAPNLNSCWPWAGVVPPNHSAPLKTVIWSGCKPNPAPALAVHFVTLPSNPNLYSSLWLVVESKPLNHDALLKTVKRSGNKPVPMSVHFVTLPSFPNLYSCRPLGSFAAEPQCIVKNGLIERL